MKHEDAVIFCRTCEIALPDGTSHCPMCQRNLHPPVILIASACTLACVLLGGLLWGSGTIKSNMDSWQVTQKDVLTAAESLVATNPAVHNPVAFSGAEHTTVEHWDGRRWRVSGYIDTRPQPGGATVRTLYYAVLAHEGEVWTVEDLQLQSMVGSGAAAPR